MFREYRADQLAVIKAKYGTEGDVLEAPLLIETKARDMLQHYVSVVMPEGFKAQVVATSRRAAVLYREKLLAARDELVAKLKALPAVTLTLPEGEIDELDREKQFLVRAHRLLERLQALDVAVVISGDHNDPESWWDWTDKDEQEEYIKRFKRRLATDRTEKTDPLSILVVNNMLITGFDAPVEQVMYLDHKVVAHDLLQAVARVNRTSGSKKCGYVVDYIGIARHLNEALQDYDREDTEGTLIDIGVELPTLLDRRDRAVALFTERASRICLDRCRSASICWPTSLSGHSSSTGCACFMRLSTSSNIGRKCLPMSSETPSCSASPTRWRRTCTATRCSTCLAWPRR